MDIRSPLLNTKTKTKICSQNVKQKKYQLNHATSVSVCIYVKVELKINVYLSTGGKFEL